MVLALDDPIQDAVLEEIREIDGISVATAVVL